MEPMIYELADDDDHKQTLDVYNFLRTSTWQPTSGDENGCSWLEILARYHALGGYTYDVAQAMNDVRPKPSLKKLLTSFVTTFRRVTTTFVQPGDTQLFRPTRNKQRRLAKYGIANHVPCIAAKLCLSQQDAAEVHQKLLQLHSPLSLQQRSLLQRGQLKLAFRKLALRRPLPWDNWSKQEGEKKLPQLRSELKCKVAACVSAQSQDKQSHVRLEVFCKNCGKGRCLGAQTLLKGTTWKHVFCSWCQASKKPPAGIALVRKLGTLVPSTGRWAWLCIDRDWLNKRFQVPAFSMPALVRLLQNAAWSHLA
jgi:hypothetical protein